MPLLIWDLSVITFMTQGRTAGSGREDSTVKRLFLLTLAIAALAACVFAVTAVSDETDADTAVTSITLDITSKTLELDAKDDANKTVVLVATITPADATNKNITWSTSDNTIATVSATETTASGTPLTASITVTAVKAGTATITATAVGGESKTATCAITVEQHVKTISLNKTATSLKVNDTEKLTVTITPSDVTQKYKTVFWTSSNNDVATVDSSGTVTAVGVGTASIKVMTLDEKTATCNVTVSTQAVTSVEILNAPTKMTIGTKATLTASVLPNNATDKSVTWTSSNNSIATVSQTGEVTAIKDGTVTITLRSVSNQSVADTCSITIEKIPVTSVSIVKDEYEYEVGDMFLIEYVVLPDNATYPQCTFSSSDSSVATVDNLGFVLAKGTGTTIITVTNTDSGVFDTCKVIISDVKTIEFDVEEVEGKAVVLNEDALKTEIKNAFDAGLQPIAFISLVSSDTVVMSASLVKTLANYKDTELVVEFPSGEMLFTQRALSRINTAEATVGIQLKEIMIPEKYADLNISKAYDLAILYGTNATAIDFKTDVIVSIPYTLAAGEDPKDLMVVYLPDSGRAKKVTNGEPLFPVYDDGEVIFKTNHFSNYAFFFHDADVGVGDFNILVMGGFLAVIICLSIFILFYLRRYDIEDTLEGYYDDGQQGL